jgi:hypothetical protein
VRRDAAGAARVGALWFRWEGGERIEAPAPDGVPSVVHVLRLLDASDRSLRIEESEEGLRLLLAPGSTLVGARPKASVVESDGALSIADAVGRHGARSDADRRELYRRLAFYVLVSNVDDHLRNHGFLWGGREGWRLSPAFDLNPMPVDVRERRLTTAIDLEEGTCDLTLVLEVAPFFGLGDREARSVVRSVADGVAAWRAVARDLGAGRAEIDRMASAFEHDDARAAARL